MPRRAQEYPQTSRVERKNQDFEERKEYIGSRDEDFDEIADQRLTKPEAQSRSTANSQIGHQSYRPKTREDKILDQIRTNIVVTEEQLNETKQKISKLEDQARNSNYAPRAPWATSGIGRDAKTSSSDYGAYIGSQRRY